MIDRKDCTDRKKYIAVVELRELRSILTVSLSTDFSLYVIGIDMYHIRLLASAAGIIAFAQAESWPYDRYRPHQDVGYVGSPPVDPVPEFPLEPTDFFVDWLRSLVNRNDSFELQSIFKNGTIPDEANRNAGTAGAGRPSPWPWHSHQSANPRSPGRSSHTIQEP
jgi:hypothetical protein